MASIVVGADNVTLQEPTMGAEDFSLHAAAKPGYCFMIANGDGATANGPRLGPCMLHNPSYDFNDDLIPLGATAWVRLAEASAGVAVLYIHGLNPYGFSHLRRTTHENVDLNRNFHNFSQPLPVNEAYREVQPLLLPPQWPPAPDNAAAIADFVAKHGQMAYQAAITRGQHEFADGLFFGGTSPTWSNQTLRSVLRQHGSRAQRIGWVDIHTGLGPNGVGERIYAGADDDAAVARARNWWAGGGATPVTSIYDGSSSSAFLTGLMWNAIYDECPQAEYTGIAMEYGTVPVMEVMQALRGEHWLHQHPETSADLAAQIRQQMKDAFYTDTDIWKVQIIDQAREALRQAANGLQNA
jgi:hypothetical protein